MGLLSTVKNYKVLGHIADAHDAAYRCFDTYEDTDEISCLKTAAWFIKAGIIDLSEKHRISPSQPIPITIMGKMVKSTVGFAATSSLHTLSIYVKYLDDDEQAYMQDIIDGGKAFREVELDIPYDIQKKYERY